MIPLSRSLFLSCLCLVAVLFCSSVGYCQDGWVPIQSCEGGTCNRGPVASVASASVQSAGRVIRYAASTPRRVVTARPIWRPFRSLSCCQ